MKRKLSKNGTKTDKTKKRSKPILEDYDDTTDEVPKSKKRKSAVTEHKETLEKLQKTDPAFYQFLKEQDAELLDFDVSDAEDVNGEESDGGVVEEPEDEEEREDDGKAGVAFSDDEPDAEEDEDDDDGDGLSKIAVTSKLVRQWEKQLSAIMESEASSSSKINSFVENIVDAFRAVVAQAGARPDKRSRYRIDDSNGFNAVVRLCFSVFPVVWQKQAGADLATSQGKQKRLRPIAKPYLHNLAEFLQEIQNADVLRAVLKHVTHVADFYSLFGSLSRRIVKVLINIWSTKDESARVLAFVSIMKLVRGTPDPLASIVLKKMYLSYVQNTKLVTPLTWPLINFMQKSYAEICGLDKQLTYQYAFVYIRQMAIHLRNAITTKKKEQIMAVYNWQFVQCLYLWGRVLSTHAKDDALKPLVYPLIQVALGCARLIPTAKYFPLRFHCIRSVLLAAREAGIYVPVLPIILEVFHQIDIKKRHSRQSLKPLDFDSLLKLSQSQLQESAFKVGVVESALELVAETMNAYATSIAFPELAYVCCSRLKSFYKSCHLPALSRPTKELSDKISEHSTWLERQRTAAAMNLATGSAGSFETRLAQSKDSPLGKYFETFKAMKERERKLKLETAGGEQETEEAVEEDKAKPMKNQKMEKKKKTMAAGKNREKQTKETTKKREGKKSLMKTKKKKFSDDVVQDLNLSDLDD